MAESIVGIVEDLWCSRCNEVKPPTDFHNESANTHRGGKHRWCKQCSSEYNKERKDDLADWHMQRKYGITIQEKHEMLSNQKDSCKICGTKINMQCHVDHCHSTGKVRGLLCGPCNMALGQVGDNIQTLENMIKYLKENQNG